MRSIREIPEKHVFGQLSGTKRKKKRLKNEYQYDDDEKNYLRKKKLGQLTEKKNLFFVDSKQKTEKKELKEEFHVEMLRATLFILHI